MSDEDRKAQYSDDRAPEKKESPFPADQALYNLENREHPEKVDPDRPPTRQPGEDDFAAEAHGFTGYEKVGKAGEKPNGPNTGQDPDTNTTEEP